MLGKKLTHPYKIIISLLSLYTFHFHCQFVFVLIIVDQKSAGNIMASARRLALSLSHSPTLAQNFFTANSNFITRIKSHPFNEKPHDEQPVVANNINFNISQPIPLKTLIESQFINNLTSRTGARGENDRETCAALPLCRSCIAAVGNAQLRVSVSFQIQKGIHYI